MLSKLAGGLLLLFVLIPATVFAMPCHCFSVRDFDPREPAAADPYYLATTQNSFFSLVFDLDKKKVVLAKQTPATTAEELWVLHWLAQKTGRDTKLLKKSKKAVGTWRAALEASGAGLGNVPGEFETLLKADADDKQLARSVVDDLLMSYGAVDAEELRSLRKADAENPEIILAVILGVKTGRKSTELFKSVHSGETTWGSLLLESGMKGRDMVAEIRGLLDFPEGAATE